MTRGPDRFVGRQIELATLTDALSRAPGDRASLWLVSGAAGIGKTRLGREVTDAATQLGWRCVWAYGWGGSGAPPFWPWTQVLRTLLDRHDTQLADLFDADDPPVDQFELFDATARALHAAATTAPVLLVLDDLHLADADSLHLLHFVLGHATSAPLVVLGTHRTGDVTESAAEALSSLLDVAGHLPLTGLGPAEVAGLLGLVPSGAPDDQVDAIHRLTSGNPLFVEEIARSQRVRREKSPARATLRDVARHRLERLAPGIRRAVDAVAVLGPHATHATVERLLLEKSGPEPDVVAGLADGVLQAGTPTADALRLAHPLFAEIAVELLAPGELEEIHARVAGMLAAADHPVGAIASHLALAGDAHRCTAVTTLVRAGQEASQRFAHTSAVSMLRRAVALAEPTGATPLTSREAELHFEAVLALAGALHRAEGRLAAEATYREAEQLARRIGDPVLLARSAARHGLEYFATGDVPLRRADLAREALETLPRGDSGLRATLMAGVAVGALARHDLDANRLLAAEAVAMARRIDDPRALGTALVAQQVSDLGPACLPRRLASAREILRLAEQTSDAALAIHGRFLLKAALLEGGELRELNSQINLQQVQITRVGEARWARHSLWFRCMQAMLDGRPDRVEELAGEIAEIADHLADPDGIGVYFGQLGVARWMQGRLVEMEEAYLSQLRDEPDEPLWPSVLAWVALADGRTQEARGWSSHFPHPGEVPQGQHTLLTLCSMADVVAAVGDETHAEELFEALLPYADRVIPIAMGAGIFGTVARPLSTLALRLGRRDQAIRHCRHALSIGSRLGARPWIVDAQLTLAELLLADPAMGQVERVEALVAEAATIRRTGTVVFDERLERISAVLADARSRAPAPTAPRPCAQVTVLGDFEVRGVDGQLARWTSRKARTLLKVLVAQGGSLVRREQAMAILWPDEDLHLLGNRFSVALTAVRRALDPGRILDVPLVVSTDDGIRLALDHPGATVRVDALVVLEKARLALSPGAPREQLQDALAGFTGAPFAEESSADWARGLRSEFTSWWCALLRRAIELSTEASDHFETAESARRLLEIDPYDEAAHRARVSALRHLGAHGRADQALTDFRVALSELGLPAPSQ